MKKKKTQAGRKVPHPPSLFSTRPLPSPATAPTTATRRLTQGCACTRVLWCSFRGNPKRVTPCWESHVSQRRHVLCPPPEGAAKGLVVATRGDERRYSPRRCPSPPERFVEEVVTRQEGSEGQVHEEYDPSRRLATSPGARPAPLSEVAGPQGRLVVPACPCGVVFSLVGAGVCT